MDFFNIKERSTKNGIIEIYPDFKVGRSKDLMIRGKSFYAIWDEKEQVWSTDEYDVQKFVDEKLLEYREKKLKKTDGTVHAKLMGDFSTKSWSEFQYFVNNLSDSSHPLDENLTFSNTKVKKTDYVSRRLPYPLEKGSIDSYDELIGTLYTPEERAKLEWAIGAVIAGDSKYIQKFIVLYGEAGAGKSTILNIIQKLFDGYYTTFEAKALTQSNNSFATEVFKTNPLVAIQHDGDLSKIEDNTKLNSIISHEDMTMNEKYKPSYMARVNAFLFMATNKPVKITDAKSGIIRRLIDVKPSGKLLPAKRYFDLMPQIDFELGAIAHHCLKVYRDMGKNFYMSYRPIDMMMQTDVFYNFVEAHFHIFKEQDGVSLTQAYDMYKIYCDESMIDWKLPRHKFREELKNYFKHFHDITRVDGKQVRSYYEGFDKEKFTQIQEEPEIPNSLFLDKTASLLDEHYPDTPAQYATKNETPKSKWANVKTTLKEIDTKKLHYMKVEPNHIVIDFDITDDSGEKSMSANLEAASKWPSTYAEFSKSGNGVHLHYFYTGDVDRLSRIYDDEIEVKVFNGDASLRRKLTKCNDVKIANINSGLPLKGEKMINPGTMKTEKSLRSLIKRNLNKEIHDATKPSIDFIHKILLEAYNSGMSYDVTDMRPYILAFANNSSNQAAGALKMVADMKFQSETQIEGIEAYDKDSKLAFFDVEVFPNLFVVVWKFEGKDSQPVRMINPTPNEITELFDLKLVGYNCRRYDNHIMYARHMGYSNEELFALSQKIINNSKNAMFGQAYGLSYTDIYDFASTKQSLKKWEIELGIKHSELGLPWDEEVPENMWEKVVDYCVDDVTATEKVFDHLYADWTARLILTDLSGLTANDTTQKHAAKILFGNDKNPQGKFIYVDLSERFEGYEYSFGKSTYRGEEVGEGGYVYAEPGMYGRTAILDIASQHPRSLIEMNHFGIYTKRFEEIVDGRLKIKHGEYEEAGKILEGKLKPYLKDTKKIKGLDYSLKIVINIVYGMTSAKFDNPFKDPRNVDNIVAKRGALFMIDLKHAVQERGYTVAHIKTDSIKIPEADQSIIDFVFDFGASYGYTFEHEATYEKICLVNDAVYIAKVESGKGAGGWDAVGTQFAEPYVYKTLFSKEPITIDDKSETKAVTTALYLDYNENLPEGEHDYHFVGKVGLFNPIAPGKGGAELMRYNPEKDKYGYASGAKGYRWLEASTVKELGKEEDIDLELYRTKVDKAIATLAKFGDVETFIE